MCCKRQGSFNAIGYILHDEDQYAVYTQILGQQRHFAKHLALLGASIGEG